MDDLARAAAYWVEHPFRAMGVYLLFVSLKVIVEGFWQGFMKAR